MQIKKSTAELVRIFFHTGEPDGIREAEIVMSTTKAVAFLRGAWKKACETAQDIKKPGVYLLIGNNPNGDGRVVYIGESEDVCERLKDHDSKEEKTFWDETVVLTVKDDWLTKGHIRHVEAAMIACALRGSWAVMNGKGAGVDAGKLPAADREVIKRFIAESTMLVEMLGYDLFQQIKGVIGTEKPNYVMSGGGFMATAAVNPDTGIVIIKAGSKARVDEAQTIPPSAKAERKRLNEIGVIEVDSGFFVFKSDAEFKSLSAAACVIAGSSVSGPASWRAIEAGTLI